MEHIKTLSETAKNLGFSDIRKFKSEFQDIIVIVSGQEMIDQRLVENRIADLSDPLKPEFQGRKKKRSRKQSGNNIGLMRNRIQRRKQKLSKLRKMEVELSETYEKSKTDFDQMQYLTAQVKVREAEAGLEKMETEVSGLIKERINEMEASGETIPDASSEE